MALFSCMWERACSGFGSAGGARLPGGLAAFRGKPARRSVSTKGLAAALALALTPALSAATAETFQDAGREAHGMLTRLCDDFGGRVTGSAANNGAIERLAEELRALIEKHVAATGSEHARGILAAWPTKLPKFVRVIPKDYKRVLACLKRAHDQGLSGDEAIMAAFEENARDLSRVGGN